jgi:hypothetical protein
MTRKNLKVEEIKEGEYLVKVGVVSFQIDRKNLEVLAFLIANTLGVNMVEDEELQEVFKRYDDLRISVPVLRVNANSQSTKEHPLGKK